MEKKNKQLSFDTEFLSTALAAAFSSKHVLSLSCNYFLPRDSSTFFISRYIFSSQPSAQHYKLKHQLSDYLTAGCTTTSNGLSSAQGRNNFPHTSEHHLS